MGKYSQRHEGQKVIEIIKKIMAEKNIKQKDLATWLNVDVSYIAGVLHGYKKLFTLDRIEQLIVFLKPSKEETEDLRFYSALERSPDKEKKYLKERGIKYNISLSRHIDNIRKEVPVLEWDNLNKSIFKKGIDLMLLAKETHCTSFPGNNNFALRINDDSMEPEFKPGNIITVDPSLKPKHDDFVVIKNGFSILRQIKIYGNKIIFHPLNQNHKDIDLDIDKYEIIGVVVSLEKLFR